jgi:protein TonB
MSARTDALEEFDSKERLGRPVTFSLVAHISVFVFAALWSAFQTPIMLGDPNGRIGGAVAVKIVQGVPLPPSRADVINPVANPVKHNVPAAPEAPKDVPTPQPKEPEVEIQSAAKKKQASESKPRTKIQKSAPQPSQNQVTSSTGAAVSSPLYSGQQQQGGVGGVGFGANSPFGVGFGWYAEALQRRLSEEWRKTLGQIEGTSANPVVISFQINRNGSIDQIRVAQSSGNRSLDYSALRAVTNSHPLQALPPALRRNSISIEMWFRLQ